MNDNNYVNSINNLSKSLQKHMHSQIESAISTIDIQKSLNEYIRSSFNSLSIFDDMSELTRDAYNNISKAASDGIHKSISSIAMMSNIQNLLSASASIAISNMPLLDEFKDKYLELDNITLDEAINDFEKIAECQIDLENISLQQMSDIINGEYSEELTYPQIDIDEFNKKANQIDFLNRFEESLQKLDELLSEARNFKDNSEPNKTLKRIFLESIATAFGNKLVSFGISLIYFWILYNMVNNEILQQFFAIFKEFI